MHFGFCSEKFNENPRLQKSQLTSVFFITQKVCFTRKYSYICKQCHSKVRKKFLSPFITQNHRVGIEIHTVIVHFVLPFSISSCNCDQILIIPENYSLLAAYLVVCRLVFQSWLVQESFSLLVVEVGDANGFYQTSIHQLFHGLTETAAKLLSMMQDRA